VVLVVEYAGALLGERHGPTMGAVGDFKLSGAFLCGLAGRASYGANENRVAAASQGGWMKVKLACVFEKGVMIRCAQNSTSWMPAIPA